MLRYGRDGSWLLQCGVLGFLFSCTSMYKGLVAVLNKKGEGGIWLKPEARSKENIHTYIHTCMHACTHARGIHEQVLEFRA